MVTRLALSLLLFAGSLSLGYWLHRRGRLTEAQASRLVRFIVMGPSPVVLCLSFWQMNLRSVEPWLLPLLGLLISASMLIPSALYLRRSGLTRPQQGAFFTCAYFSNLGYFGAFTAFAMFGEAAFALCMLYLVFFSPSFYSWGFWIAARYGHPKSGAGFGSAFKDDLRLYPFVGMLLGALLSFAQVPRPHALEQLNHALIPMDTALYLIAIGSQLSFASPRPWLRPCLVMSGIKFLYAPAVAWLVLAAFGIEGLPRFVVMLEASTPVAVSPLVLPLLFGLDKPLANALWLFTTVLAVPVFAVIVPLLAASH
jgi:predicted permease